MRHHLDKQPNPMKTLQSAVIKTEPITWRSLQFLQENNFKDLSDTSKQKLKNSLVDPKPSKTVSLFKKKIAKNSSNLSQEQIEAINKQIDTLEKEIKSSWPYPNKERKQIKKHALEKLIEYAQKDPVATAVAKIIEEFPDAIKGTLSKRTATLLASLQTETPKKQI